MRLERFHKVVTCTLNKTSQTTEFENITDLNVFGAGFIVLSVKGIRSHCIEHLYYWHIRNLRTIAYQRKPWAEVQMLIENSSSQVLKGLKFSKISLYKTLVPIVAPWKCQHISLDNFMVREIKWWEILKSNKHRTYTQETAARVPCETKSQRWYTLINYFTFLTLFRYLFCVGYVFIST